MREGLDRREGEGRERVREMEADDVRRERVGKFLSSLFIQSLKPRFLTAAIGKI